MVHSFSKHIQWRIQDLIWVGGGLGHFVNGGIEKTFESVNGLTISHILARFGPIYITIMVKMYCIWGIKKSCGR